MRIIFLFLFFLIHCIAFAQYVASDEEIYAVSANFAKHSMNIPNPYVSIVGFPTEFTPLYEVSLENELTLIVSSQKIATPILAIIDNSSQMSVIKNPNIPNGLQYMIDKYIHQILYAMEEGENFIHPRWEELLNDEYRGGNSNRTVYGPYVTTAWGQSCSNEGAPYPAYNYYIDVTDKHCDALLNYKCPTGCVATAMAQIMKYWNYPVFRAGKKMQYDWCNMPDSLFYYERDLYFQNIFIENEDFEKQRNAIAWLMADCGEAAGMYYCCHNFIIPNRCQSFAWPVDARNALVDSFQYSSDAIRRLRSDFLTQPDTWKNFLIQDLQNGRPLIYAGASYSIGGYGQSGHAFVCDGYNEGTDMFHFNWGDLSDAAWCALDAIIVDNNNYNHLERAVFNIHPSSSENHCDFDLELWYHYITFYNPFVTTPHPYQNVPPTATRLFSVPISVSNGSETYYFDDSLRTIPSGATSEYIAHKEVVLQPGFTALSGSNFTARIEPCAECEEERGMNLPSLGERNLGGDVVHRVPTTTMADGLVIYPNPTGGTLTVESASPIREITVYDLSARVVMTVECGVAVVETCCSASPQQPYTLNVSSLQNGLYLLKAVTDSGVQTARFVKN